LIAYKFLRPDGASVFTGFRWALPEEEPGHWVEGGRVDPCRSGVHACRVADLPFWLGDTLYEIELDGEIVEHRSKLVAARGRLLRRVEAWDDELRQAYTRMCADRAHDLAFSVSPPLEPWDAIVEPATSEGPALLGFVAARIAEELSGLEAFREERARQAAWLADRLGLQTSGRRTDALP
jgi:hypothetical protein